MTIVAPSRWTSSSLFNPLVPLHESRGNQSPVVCIPGAGASVTSFLPFVTVLSGGWSVYGLQPRGLDLADPPFERVEAEAECNLGAMEELVSDAPVHLVGHSHGGRVAFEMALKLQQRRISVASLTLIDSEPPDDFAELRHETSSEEVLQEFVKALEGTFETRLSIDPQIVPNENIQESCRALHSTLIRKKCLPKQSTPDVLWGSLEVFKAVKSMKYRPSARYASRLGLVLVPEPDVSPRDDDKRREDYAAKWLQHAEQLESWCGPGRHHSILRSPQVEALATWWRQWIQSSVPKKCET